MRVGDDLPVIIRVLASHLGLPVRLDRIGGLARRPLHLRYFEVVLLWRGDMVNCPQRLALASQFHDELTVADYPSARPGGFMSVTLARGIIATFRVNTPVASSIRGEVATK